MMSLLLPPPNEVCCKVMSSEACVSHSVGCQGGCGLPPERDPMDPNTETLPWIEAPSTDI